MPGRRIVIEEHGSPAAPAPKASPRFDLQDALLILGVILLEIAAAVIWWPASLILGGILSLGFALLIERSKNLKPPNGPAE